MDGANLSSEVVTAGTALAGLILIYIGALITSFGSYQASEQKSVKFRFLGRAWLSFVGLFLSLLAASLAILGKWFGSACVGNVSVCIILAAFAWAVFATVLAIQEIK